ncbi:hypothetical protein ACFL59_03735 [Planctomycetota bacterium]
MSGGAVKPRNLKMEYVLRLLRGEDLDAVSRELEIRSPTLATWRRTYSRRDRCPAEADNGDHAQHAHSGPVIDLAFLDGKGPASHGRVTIIWDLNRREGVRKIRGPTGAAMASNAAGTRLVQAQSADVGPPT